MSDLLVRVSELKNYRLNGRTWSEKLSQYLSNISILLNENIEGTQKNKNTKKNLKT